jgi:hypothetical protein
MPQPVLSAALSVHAEERRPLASRPACLVHLMALDVTMAYLGYLRTARCSEVLCVQRTIDFSHSGLRT